MESQQEEFLNIFRKMASSVQYTISGHRLLNFTFFGLSSRNFLVVFKATGQAFSGG